MTALFIFPFGLYEEMKKRNKFVSYHQRAELYRGNPISNSTSCSCSFIRRGRGRGRGHIVLFPGLSPPRLLGGKIMAL